MLIEIRSSLDPELAALITAQQRELEAAGAEADRMFEPGDDVAYLVGVVNGRAVACGAWQETGPGAAELRRLYVRPAFRGRGLARQMIVAIEEEALAADRPLLRLELGARLSAAIALYQSSGYRQVPSTGPHRVRFEKRLPALVQ
ncbi:GNAT family N-acetyltransferase [Actinoplanes sp. NEAU-A12]|uniref:GNAT family N-acetyltransferase n=1 Tax=Actinoplanes sandaracinus TaxID=3045177 RepID=A0ABT6WEZ6_9ACTN|nr:GNAT family N-acetyltransferase [Actinoplanes sandaracinus]MDI6098282.1 GNAT family N-acetyltransferase [Actinoplanes sandaracinus]